MILEKSFMVMLFEFVLKLVLPFAYLSQTISAQTTNATVAAWLWKRSLGHEREIHHSSSTAAVWGEPTPDYSLLQLGGEPHRILKTLLFLDRKTTEHYGFDLEEVRIRVIELIQEANSYFIQFRLGLVLVDILQTDRSDLSLYSFQEYRNQRLHKLPHHDFAVLLSFKYAGGLAFVGGMCTSQSVMLCGFFPQQPSAMGSIFFHEVAHLMGVPHKEANSTLKVPQCTCKPASSESIDEPCLKIPGFDHDCTAQQLANIVYKNRCLKSGHKMESSISICGNGVVEEGEQCDCGLAAQCSTTWNCEYLKCEYKMHPIFLWMISLFLLCAFLLILLMYGYWRGWFLGFTKKSGNKSTFQKNVYRSQSFLNYTSSPYHKKKHIQASQISPSSIVVLLDGQQGQPGAPMTPNSASRSRPKLPPPPPPPSSQLVSKSKISVQLPSGYEIPNSQLQQPVNDNMDNLSWKFDDFDSGDEDLPPPFQGYPIGQVGVPTLVEAGNRHPIQRVTVQYRGGSDQTMSTNCPSTSNSDASLMA
ncbi:unnamed protein product, partial [Mesorhabditis belari]|uniref:Peptidase M12B domain-containing protein n=1 Tax=Mesorhabditis belari TaxID=2138241 RepID=A0AAF3FKI7_9BILA